MHFAPGRPATRTRPGIRRSGAQASAGATSSFRSRHRPSATRTFPPRRSSRIASSRRVVARAASLLLLLLLLRSFFPINHPILTRNNFSLPYDSSPTRFRIFAAILSSPPPPPPRSMFPSRLSSSASLLLRSIGFIGSRWLAKGQGTVCPATR